MALCTTPIAIGAVVTSSRSSNSCIIGDSNTATREVKSGTTMIQLRNCVRGERLAIIQQTPDFQRRRLEIATNVVQLTMNSDELVRREQRCERLHQRQQMLQQFLPRVFQNLRGQKPVCTCPLDPSFSPKRSTTADPLQTGTARVLTEEVFANLACSLHVMLSSVSATAGRKLVLNVTSFGLIPTEQTLQVASRRIGAQWDDGGLVHLALQCTCCTQSCSFSLPPA